MKYNDTPKFQALEGQKGRTEPQKISRNTRQGMTELKRARSSCCGLSIKLFLQHGRDHQAEKLKLLSIREEGLGCFGEQPMSRMKESLPS